MKGYVHDGNGMSTRVSTANTTTSKNTAKNYLITLTIAQVYLQRLIIWRKGYVHVDLYDVVIVDEGFTSNIIKCVHAFVHFIITGSCTCTSQKGKMSKREEQSATLHNYSLLSTVQHWRNHCDMYA